MIDTDIFQVVTLVLLFLILIALLAVLSTLNGVKKEMGRGPVRAAGEESYAPASAYGEAEATAGYGAYGGGYGAQQVGTQPSAAQQEVATGYVPMSQVPAAEQPAAQTPALSGTEPEEQPFERDGRWWFKRGDELLVYDEGTGQWVPAGGAPRAAAPVTSGAAAAPATTTTAYPTTGAEAGEGWRCPSCGAINGSTATVCRMCFTPRG